MSKKKILKISLISLGCLLLIFLGIGSYVHRQIDQLIKERINQALGEGIKADYRKSHIGFAKNIITLKHLEVSKQNDTLEFWKGHISEITLHGFQALPFLKGEGVAIDSITIEKPEFKLFAFDNDTTESPIEQDSINPKTHIELAIAVIQVNNGVFEIDQIGPEQMAFDFNLRIKDISLVDLLKKQPLDELNNIDLAIENFNYQFPDSIYCVKADGIKALSNVNTIHVTNVDVHSNLSKSEYAKYYGKQKVIFDIKIPEISIDRPTSFRKDSLIFPKIRFDGLIANLSKNKNYPLPNRHTELPQYMMAKMGVKLRCDSVIVKGGELNFESIQSTGELATVELAEINGTILAFQNIDTLLPAFTLIVESKLQDEADVEFETVYSYGPLEPFVLKGSMGNTRLEFMDDFLMKMVGIKIEEGSLKKLNFEMTGNTYGVNGFVDFYYNSLEIHAIDKETGKDKKMINFISNVVGGLVFWHENPSKDHFRRGSFYVDRDVRKGFISQWTDGLLHGIMNTVSKVDPNKVERTSKSIKGKFSKKKK